MQLFSVRTVLVSSYFFNSHTCHMWGIIKLLNKCMFSLCRWFSKPSIHGSTRILKTKRNYVSYSSFTLQKKRRIVKKNTLFIEVDWHEYGKTSACYSTIGRAHDRWLLWFEFDLINSPIIKKNTLVTLK